MNLILKKSKNGFSYIRYFLFSYFKRYNLYEKYIEKSVFKIPYKNELKPRYKEALKEFLRYKKTEKILPLDDDLKEYFKKYFSVICGENIYNTIVYDALEFLAGGRLYEYEIVFVSDNIKEIKNIIEKCIKYAGGISVLTKRPELYEGLAEFTLYKYGVLLNIKTKNEKLKKNKKIYVNCGHSVIFDKGFFKNVNMLDIYNVYDGAKRNIILKADEKEKEFSKSLNCPFSIGLAEFLYGKECDKKFKIVSIKKYVVIQLMGDK